MALQRREPSRAELTAFESGFQRGLSRTPKTQRQGQKRRREIRERYSDGTERIVTEEIEDYTEESWW